MLKKGLEKNNIERLDVANIHSVHKFYWHILDYGYKPKSFIEKAETQLIDPPYKYGDGIAIRPPFSTKAVVIGLWKGTIEEETEALTRAINGKPLDNPVWDKIRYGE